MNMSFSFWRYTANTFLNKKIIIKHTPCIGDCVMEDSGYCRGCKRTLEEISIWGKISSKEKEEIYRILEKRKEGEKKLLTTSV
jgi:predicted Fe-S protein YdhL (DUF1289 family)